MKLMPGTSKPIKEKINSLHGSYRTVPPKSVFGPGLSEHPTLN